ncbi:MAG TPA: hypothetical protein PKA98_12530, partial [Acidimicrobiales bacterium]|nr:hypothetical protein [Acidimicrobiales bacterium]
MSGGGARRRGRHRLLKAVLALLIAYLLGDALKSRRRLAALPVLEPSDEPADEAHRVVTAAGVHVGPETRRAASAFLRREGLAAVDLVPGDLPAEEALELAALVDPATYRTTRLAPGRGAGKALVVDETLLERADLDAIDGLDPVAFLAAEVELKRVAPLGVDVAGAAPPASHPPDP